MAEIRYLCSKCHSPYETEAEALECEQSHVEIESINRYEYNLGERYPEELEVIFSDTQQAIYSRVKMIRRERRIVDDV